jgi:hypothetical protein
MPSDIAASFATGLRDDHKIVDKYFYLIDDERVRGDNHDL